MCNILNHGCEVWGSHKGPNIEQVHDQIIWYALGVCKNTNTYMIYFEIGRLPLYSIRIFRMFKFCSKIIQSENCIRRISLKCPCRLCKRSKKYLAGCPLLRNNYIVWNLVTNGVNTHVCLQIIRQRLKDQFIQNLQSKIQYLADDFYLQFYLQKNIQKLYFQNNIVLTQLVH